MWRLAGLVGGYGTKACVIADGQGLAIAFRVAPGQAHELPEAIPLLEKLPGVPSRVVTDRGYSSHSFREHIWSLGAGPFIPTKSDEVSAACPAWIYNNRNVVERLWARLKEWRAVAIDGLERWQSSTQQFRQVSLTHLSIISCRVLEEEVVILGRLGAREVELGHRGLVAGGF